MKKLIVYFIILAISILSAVPVIILIPGNIPHDLASIIDKRQKLIETPSPRLLVIGGSSSLTLKSPEIEEATGYHVLNMSIWGGLGTAPFLEEIKPYIRKGDVVLITQEYGAILDHKFHAFTLNNDEAKKCFFLMSPMNHLRQYFYSGEWSRIILTLHEICQLKMKSFIRNALTLNMNQLFKDGYPEYHKEFNEHGDRLNPYTILRPLDGTGKILHCPNMKFHNFLNDFNHYAQARGVTVLFYFSHFPREEYEINREKIDSFAVELIDFLEFSVINKPTDFIYPRDFFGDTIYHLNERGEIVRTKMLIDLLCTHISCKPDTSSVTK